MALLGGVGHFKWCHHLETMRKQVVFSFGGINVLPALLTDFGRRGVLARALAA